MSNPALFKSLHHSHNRRFPATTQCIPRQMPISRFFSCSGMFKMSATMKDAKVFSLIEAKSLIPWLREASQVAEDRIIELQRRKISPAEFQNQSMQIIQHWAQTVLKLGALPKQPFTVDFDSGQDYYCWEFPESDIFYRHDYHLGYRGRKRINEE